MNKKDAKTKIKIGCILIDDCKLLYEVIEKFENSIVVVEMGRTENLAGSIITYSCIENEDWKIATLIG